jgi:hypothetical protein
VTAALYLRQLANLKRVTRKSFVIPLHAGDRSGDMRNPGWRSPYESACTIMHDFAKVFRTDQFSVKRYGKTSCGTIEQYFDINVKTSCILVHSRAFSCMGQKKTAFLGKKWGLASRVVQFERHFRANFSHEGIRLREASHDAESRVLEAHAFIRTRPH